MDIYFYLGLALIVLVFAAYIALVHYGNKKPQKEIVFPSSEAEVDKGNVLLKNFFVGTSALRQELEKKLSFKSRKRRIGETSLKNHVEVLAHPRRAEKWFKAHINEIAHDGYCLEYLNKITDLEMMFWKNIEELNIDIAHDAQFQRLLISLQAGKPFSKRLANFKYLLFSFASRYELMPEFLQVINTDPRFERAKELYKSGRNFRKAMGKPFEV